jgi:hypothetical protein
MVLGRDARVDEIRRAQAFCRSESAPVLDMSHESRGVAQPGSARALGARRRGFKSRLPDQNYVKKPGKQANRDDPFEPFPSYCGGHRAVRSLNRRHRPSMVAQATLRSGSASRRSPSLVTRRMIRSRRRFLEMRSSENWPCGTCEIWASGRRCQWAESWSPKRPLRTRSVSR